ncbi:amidohydrolase family protein [Sediminibacillus dalangtanensis]|uniref:Amidohydrolase family protein n=1 Tax=Sediminibacillus dalangtanensis TaxID=2729421 RepID=A0ABX7VUG8_9BACI|nr:amidohydrolase [Sediminibacillus dalangtanensis]QTN00612.1 amidohydrolase family protein [Sediminibacillus dalangtanensis]
MKAITNVTGVDGTGQKMEDVTILIENGKFLEIGRQLVIPEGTQTIDAHGKFFTPGLIDVHTHLGVHEEGIGKEGQDFNETSHAATPEVRSIDGINPFDKGFSDARNAGVTTVQVMPGSANVIGGEMCVLKTAGTIVDQMVIRNPSGLKAATGENPKRFHGEKGRMPVTRMGVAAILRQKLIETENYIAKRKAGTADRDLAYEQLAKVLNKEIPLRVHAHRADDIVTVLRIKREFSIDVTIEHCTEGHLLAPYLAEHGVRVSSGPTMTPRSKVELSDKGWHTLPALAEAGVPFSITTDHPVIAIEHLMTSAIMSVKNGLSEAQAMRAITMDAAKHLGVESRVGSVEAGKDADFVLWSGSPFDLQSKVEKTFIEGQQV